MINSSIIRLTATWLALCLCMFIATAQYAYQPLVVDGAHWKIHSTVAGEFCMYPYSNEAYNWLKIEGDSLFNGEMFKKLYQTRVYGDSIGDYLLCGLIREDSLRRVYLRQFEGLARVHVSNCYCSLSSTYGFDSTFLVMDFGWQAGDTVCNEYGGGGCYLMVDTVFVDSMDWSSNQMPWGYAPLTHDSLLRIQVRYDDNCFGSYPFVVLVERLGYASGLINFIVTFESNCDFKVIDYCLGTDSMCGLFKATVLPNTEENEQVVWRLYPNPATDYVQVEGSEAFNYAICNTLGQPLLHGQVQPLQPINVSALPVGIYVLAISTPEGEGYSKRLLLKQ